MTSPGSTVIPDFTVSAAVSPSHVPAGESTGGTESLFERFGWFYSFLRERVFQDDTERIATTLWPEAAGAPAARSNLLEVGCGPGFYARRLAARFSQLQVIGVDRSDAQLRRAKRMVARQGLNNCRFRRADARALPWVEGTVDVVLSSRLFTILPEGQTVLAEMFRVLRPGGRCFMAEPRSPIRAGLPLKVLWALARVAPDRAEREAVTYREPVSPAIFDAGQFARLVASQPWADARHWEDGNYQYALCTKRRSPGEFIERLEPSKR